MKRSAALAPLSRDHQHALYAALLLRRATSATAADATEHFRDFFEREGRHHFDVEERLILPALPADDPDWSDAVERVREDHAAIREHASALGDLEIEAIQALGTRLNDHVRFEERVLFTMLEDRLSVGELLALGTAVAGA